MTVLFFPFRRSKLNIFFLYGCEYFHPELNRFLFCYSIESVLKVRWLNVSQLQFLLNSTLTPAHERELHSISLYLHLSILTAVIETVMIISYNDNAMQCNAIQSTKILNIELKRTPTHIHKMHYILSSTCVCV